MATDWQQKFRAMVEPHVPEPVVAVGMLQPAGSLGSMGLAQLSPLAAMIKRKRDNKRAGGLARDTWSGTKTAVIALTAGRVYAFSAKAGGRGWKIVDDLGNWDRSDVRFTTEPGKAATKVVIDIASTGDHHELEATTAMTRGLHDDFLAQIATV